MGCLIEILFGKGDREFNIFCDMLDNSNHRGWANSLRLQAKPNRQKEGKKWKGDGGGWGDGEGGGDRGGEEHCYITQTTETPYNAGNT